MTHRLFVPHLTRTQVPQHGAEGKKTEQDPGKGPELPRLHGLPGEQSQHSDRGQRNDQTAAARGFEVHTGSMYAASVRSIGSTAGKDGAQGRIRTSVAHNAADLQSAAINHSATCASSAIRPESQPFHRSPGYRMQRRFARIVPKPAVEGVA